MTAGFIYAHAKFPEGSWKEAKAHALMGNLVFAFGIIWPIGGFLRPDNPPAGTPKSKHRIVPHTAARATPALCVPHAQAQCAIARSMRAYAWLTETDRHSFARPCAHGGAHTHSHAHACGLVLAYRLATGPARPATATTDTSRAGVGDGHNYMRHNCKAIPI